MGGLNYITTILQMRTRGMTLMRMPLTLWGIFCRHRRPAVVPPAVRGGGSCRCSMAPGQQLLHPGR